MSSRNTLTFLLKQRLTYCLALSLLTGVTPAATRAQEARIAAVNSDRILRESVPAKTAQAKLAQEFSKRDRDLQATEARLKAMSGAFDHGNGLLSDAQRIEKQRQLAQLDAEFQRKQREFREDLNQRRNEELAAVLERANKAIKQIAEQNHYDLIVQEAVYVSPRIDITDQVLKALATPNASGG